MTTPTFRAGAATHVGLIRTMNEDSFIVGEGLFAVADGMGGHLAGEVASQMAIHALDQLAAKGGSTSLDGVVAAVNDANEAILRMSQDDPTRRGMGTTLTVLALVRAAGDADGGAIELAVVNLGDSRTYRLRNGVLEQITVDHSYVQELVSAGHLTPDEARYHPQRNIVTRALGIEPGIGIDVWNLPVVRGDRYLLCSDGLVDEVPDDRIAEALQTLEDPQAAAEHLVDMANRAGGRDNVTVVIVDVVDAPPPTEPDTATPGAHADSAAHDDTITADPAMVGADTAAAATEPDPQGDTALAAPDGIPAEDGTVTITTTPPATGPADPAGTTRRTRLGLIALFGGLAVLAGIVFTVLRDDDEPTPTTVTVPETSRPAATPPTTAVVATDGAGQPDASS